MAFQAPKFLYDNRFADATPVASSTAAGYAVANLLDWKRFTWWQPTVLPATITVDCASAQAADYCVVFGHDLAAQGATLEVRGSTDNFAASDVLVATVTPTSDKPILLTWASVSYRYWRIRITGSTVPSLAIVAVGAALEMPAYLDEGFDPTRSKAEGEVNRSVRGHALGRVSEFRSWSQGVKFSFVEWDWIRDTWRPAWQAHLEGTPFGFAWDGGDHADEVYLVESDGEYQTPHRAGSYADLSLELMGVSEW